MQPFISVDSQSKHKRKVALVLGTALLLGLAFLAVGCESTTQRRLDHVRTLEQQGDLLGALGELRAILLEVPDQPEANYRLGRYLVQSGEQVRAVWPLERAFQSPEFQQPAGELLLSVYLDDENLQRVLRIANTLLADKPNLPSARLARGHAYLGLDQGELALRDARSVSHKDPTNLQAALLEAKAFWKLEERGSPRDAHNAGKGAKKRYRELLEANPTHPVVLAAAYEYFTVTGHPEQFLEILKRIAEQAPEQLDIQVNYVQALLGTGDVNGALGVLAKALSHNDENPSLYVLKARIEKQAGKLASAEASFEKALVHDSEFSPALTGLAVLALDRGQLEQALERIEKAQAKATNGDPFFIAAGILQQLGRHEQAIQALRQAIARTPGDSRALNNLAWELAEHGGDLDEALHLARLSARLSRDAEVLDTLGWIHWKRGEILPARINFEDSLRSRESPSVRYHLGLALEKLGDPLGARIQFKRALASGSPFPEAEQARNALARLPAMDYQPGSS